MDTPLPLASLLATRRVIIVVGAGGVGKTSLSAAIGVAAARQGRRALVLTVDPARRLASALGLEHIDAHAQTLPVATFAALGAPTGADLDVAMLDVKSTFDRVVRRYTGDGARAERIFAHPMYRSASTALAGSQEYMAMERLAEVAEDPRYDTIVLDTPPSAHALDFLDAPRRMVDLFESKAFRALLRPFANGGAAVGLFSRDSLMMRGLGRFTSADSFHELLAFFADLSSMFDGFVARARGVQALLAGPTTAFVLASATDGPSTDEADYLRRRLTADAMQAGLWLVNRVIAGAVGIAESRDELNIELEQTLADSSRRANEALDAAALSAASGALVRAAAAIARLAAADRARLDAIAARAGATLPVVAVARRASEPVDLLELSGLAAELLATPAHALAGAHARHPTESRPSQDAPR